MIIVRNCEVDFMTEKPTPKEPESLSCEICLAEIPESVAMSSEADEYAQHFCGVECYSKWREIIPDNLTPDTK